MNTVLLFKEFKREFKGFLIGSVIVVGYLSLIIAIFSSMDFGFQKIAAIWGTLPQGFSKAFNFDVEKWKSIMGFYSTYFVFLIPVISGGFSVVWGLKQLSKEEYHKTAEFLLTRPISRDQIVTAKLTVLIAYIAGINLLAWLAGLVSCSLASKTGFSVGNLTILHLYGMIACLFFGILGFFISVLIKRGRTNVGLGLGIVIGAYLFDMIIKLYGKADFLLYLTPFKYIDLEVTQPDYQLEGWRILVPLAASILLVLMSYLLYRKKDIYT